MALQDKRWYVSLDALKNELGLTDTTHDAKLKRYIERASRWVEHFTSRTFIPVTATRYFDAPEHERGALYLRDDLLIATTISDDQGAVSSSEYFLYPLNDKPKTRVELLHSNKFWYFQDTRQKAISIVGTWGYSDNYEDTSTTLGAAITSTSATTFTSSDGSQIQVGWCLLVDSEQLFVKSVSSNTVTVQRGNNGTTAATHSNGATVYRYVPEPDAEEAAVLLASTWYYWRDAGGVKEKTIGDYAVTYEDGWPVPVTIKETLTRLRRLI
jgi:hypothetical protein